MIKQIFISLLLTAFFFSSCKQRKYQTQEKTLNYLLKNDDYLKNKKCVILIPAMGCGKCTEEIINFSKNEINNNSLLFIYSDLTNKTDLVFRNIAIKKGNFFKDSLSILTSKGVLENKPIACFIKKNEIIDIIKFDDSNAKKIINRIKK